MKRSMGKKRNFIPKQNTHDLRVGTLSTGILSYIFLKLQTPGYYNWILVNYIMNITKRPDINVTSGKPREIHMTCEPFANLVEWCLNYSRQVLFSLSLAVTVEFHAGLVDLIAIQFRFLPPLNRSCIKTQLYQSICCCCCSMERATCCRIHWRPVMVRYGLAKVLRGVKTPQTRKGQGLASHSENF